MFKAKFALIFILLLLAVFMKPASADELSDINKKIEKKNKELNELTKDRDSLVTRIEELSKNLSATKEDIAELTGQITTMEKKLAEINATLEIKRLELAEKIELRNLAIRRYYKENSVPGIAYFFLSDDSLGSYSYSGFQRSATNYIQHKALSGSIRNTIGYINNDIIEYEGDKKDAEDIKTSLDGEKKKLEAIRSTLQAEQAAAEKTLDSLDEEIKKVNSSLSDLSSKQQEILREKFGSTSESNTVGDSEQSSSTLPEPSFKPAYAFFTYGYPHRVGANQYGMYGRSKEGQDYKTILKAYFKDVDISGSCDKGKSISVQGYGKLKLEDTYLMGIGEMPESWAAKGGYEALKAQAVLARTYALNYTEYSWDSKSGSLKKRSSPITICTTQSCQVYTGKKKTGAWKKAVEETCGVTIKYKGAPITAWYSSTDGGFTRTSGQVWGSDRPWTKGIRDAKCSGNLFDCAYDGPKYGNSPWFHKAWGVNKSSGNAWMKASEVEDIFNAYLLSNKDSSYNKYLSPVDKGGWSASKVEDKLKDLGIQPVGDVKGVSMKDDGTGFTTSVILKSSNYGEKVFEGYKFKSIFNLRAPGTLVIWTSFFDVLVKN